MKYKKVIEAKFISRPNRFVAYVEIDGVETAVHVKNTGRCKELLIPGVKVILSDSENENRKYRYDLVTVWKESVGWVNIDSQAPNQVVKEWLKKTPAAFPKLTLIKPECTFKDSRFDFYLEQNDKKIFMEVKGCTLERDGIGYFPDAPTERGVKHLRELIKAKEEGYDAYLAFVIAMENVDMVYPNIETHVEFGEALGEAVKAGVKVLYLCCRVSPDEFVIERM